MDISIKQRFRNWLFQLRGPQRGVIVLRQRRIFIVPTRQGLLFAGILLLMLAGSINYGLSIGFVLTFLLIAMAVNAMLHTFRNLANLRVTAGRSPPVFAGETACFTVCIENPGDSGRYAVGLTRDRKDAVFSDVPQRQTVFLSLGVPARRRGWLRPDRLTLFTRYPVGLYYAWAYLEFDVRCLVYPHPAPPGLPLPPVRDNAGQGADRGMGHEDFSGLREYRAGDSPRHVAWKAAARDETLLTKQFSGRADSELWLSWELLPPQLAAEERVSRLTRWVIDAHALGLSFGLKIPGVNVAPAAGDPQRQRCLEALALFEADGARNG